MSLAASASIPQTEIQTAQYAAIIGTSPSKGARSPVLWNAAFKGLGLDAQMVPLDTPLDDLPETVRRLKEDIRFIGGACTVPHKMAILPLLDRVEPQAQQIGAVNCLYRDGSDLVGANTDGAGALSTLEEAVGSIQAKKIAVIGLGGAGRAVAVYLAEAAGETVLVNRTAHAAEELAEKLPKASVGAFPPSRDVIAGVDVIVNCTSLGFAQPISMGGRQVDVSELAPLSASMEAPLNRRESERLLAAAKADTVVFDIIYQPLKTPLLALAEAAGLKTVNGLAMNLEQAVIAFQKAGGSNAPLEKIRQWMQGASG